MDSNVYLFILFSVFFTCWDLGQSDETVPEWLINVKKTFFEEEQAALILAPKEDILRYWNASREEGIFSSLALNNRRILKMDPDESIMYSLYNREEPGGVNFTLETLDDVVFPKKNGVKVIIHGWRSSGDSRTIEMIKDAYLTDQDVNVIGIDWSFAAETLFYPFSAHMTSHVGKSVATLIDSIAERYNYNYEDFHIIGHSLGAHVSGFTGRNTKSKVGRITGLDPALPGFEFLEIAGGKLGKEDAHFVDVIHSCVHALGITIPLGHVDFYPNGGTPLQPGCTKPLFPDTAACSHSRSYEYFTASITDKAEFYAKKCNNWNEFVSDSCPDEYTIMGDQADPHARGIYYLRTASVHPFYLGFDGMLY